MYKYNLSPGLPLPIFGSVLFVFTSIHLLLAWQKRKEREKRREDKRRQETRRERKREAGREGRKERKEIVMYIKNLKQYMAQVNCLILFPEKKDLARQPALMRPLEQK